MDLNREKILNYICSRGFFISFCGLDGSGKTTQAKKLNKFLDEMKWCKVNTIHGYKPQRHVNRLIEFFEKNNSSIHDYLTPEINSIAYLCDVWENMENLVLPKLSKGEIVILERYILTSLVYAPLYGTNEKFIKELIKLFRKPDLFVYIDLNPEIAYHRIHNRKKKNKDIEISFKEKKEILKKATIRYKKFLSKERDVIYINGNKSIDDVHIEIVTKINKFILNKISKYERCF